MNTNRLQIWTVGTPRLLCVAGLLWVAGSAWGQPSFNGGSTGAYGPIAVVGDTTLPVPEDGVFHATTIQVSAGATLRFSANSNNTAIYLLATGPVVIDGVLDLRGQTGGTTAGGAGGPGGFRGGAAGSLGVSAERGGGPGGGKAMPLDWAYGGGGGSHRTQPRGDANPPTWGPTYGSPLLVPPTGGSGGGGSRQGGSGGGGAITLVSNDRITVSATGRIDARGGPSAPDNNDGYGAGGSIRLVAPLVAGAGQLLVQGGTVNGAPDTAGTLGGYGYVRIDTLDRSGIGFGYGFQGQASIGSLLMGLPAVRPQLAITRAADEVIPDGAGPATVILPQGSSPNTTVEITLRDFHGLVPVQLHLTPESGDRLVLSATVDNRTTNPASYTFAVQLPVNVRVTLMAFAGKELPPVP